MKLVVIIPAYNERKTIASVINGIPSHIDGIDCVEVLVVDDGSTDGTVKEVRRAGENNILAHQENQGLGVAFRDGLGTALEMGADIVVNLDADGQYNTAEIPKLIQPILDNEADVVLGWRDIDKLDFMPKSKKLGNKLATRVTKMLSGFPIKDAQTGFRAFSRDAGLRMNLSGKYTYVQETLMQAKYKGLRIGQVPVEFSQRDGESRLISSLPSYAARAGQIILVTFKDYQPLRLFFFSGGILTLIGLGFSMRVIVHLAQTGGVSPYIPSAVAASLLIIIGLGTVLFGLLADMFKKQRLLQEEILYRLKKSERGREEHGDSLHNA